MPEDFTARLAASLQRRLDAGGNWQRDWALDDLTLLAAYEASLNTPPPEALPVPELFPEIEPEVRRPAAWRRLLRLA